MATMRVFNFVSKDFNASEIFIIENQAEIYIAKLYCYSSIIFIISVFVYRLLKAAGIISQYLSFFFVSLCFLRLDSKLLNNRVVSFSHFISLSFAYMDCAIWFVRIYIKVFLSTVEFCISKLIIWG
jgi:hypothetical protein